MTDYFALLDQARAPWLDSEALKQVFHGRTRHAHPDTRTAHDGDAAFAQLNEAYQVLRDPKRRLQHLLSLRGETPASQGARIPADVERLFPAVAGLTRQADAVLAKIAASTSALSRSLAQPELLRTRADLEGMLDHVRELHRNAEEELRTVEENATARLQQLYLRFSYLGRWIAELEEKLLRLST